MQVSGKALCFLPSLGRVGSTTGSGRVPWVQALPDGPSGSLTTCCLQPSPAQHWLQQNQQGELAQLWDYLLMLMFAIPSLFS